MGSDPPTPINMKYKRDSFFVDNHIDAVPINFMTLFDPFSIILSINVIVIIVQKLSSVMYIELLHLNQ